MKKASFSSCSKAKVPVTCGTWELLEHSPEYTYCFTSLHEIFLTCFFSQYWGGHILWHLNSAILLKFGFFNHFNFAILSNTIFFLGMFNMSLNLVTKRYNNIKICSMATAGLYMYVWNNKAVHKMSHKQFMLVCQQLATVVKNLIL